MLTLTTLFEAENDLAARTPVFEIEIAGITGRYSTHPLCDYDTEVLNDTPVLYLKLSEASGTTAEDSSGNNLDGLYQNTPTQGATGPISGDSAGAVTLNGSDEYVSVADNTLLDTGDTFTLEAWVKSIEAKSQTLFSKGNTSYRFYIDASGFLTIDKTGTGTIVTATAAMALGTFYHVMVTKSGSTTKLYLNGADVTGTVSNQTIANTAADLEIGKTSGSSNYLNGTIARTAIYATALSVTRAKAHYEAGLCLQFLSATSAYMQLPKGVASEIEPEKGRASIGATGFVLNDVDGAITDLIGRGVGNKLATLRMGYPNVQRSNFVTLEQGYVSDIEATPDGAGYQFVSRNPQVLVNKSVFEVATASLTTALAATGSDTFLHYLQLPQGKFPVTNSSDVATFTTLLNSAYGAGNWSFYAPSVGIIGSTAGVGDTSLFRSAGHILIDTEIAEYTTKTSTSFGGPLTRAAFATTATGHNVGSAVREVIRLGPGHPCDLIQQVYTLTDKRGLGISSSLIDTAAFDAAKTALGSTYQMEFRITERQNAKQFLENELFSVINAYPVTNAGKLSIKLYDAPTDSDSIATFDHDSIIGTPKWKLNLPSLVNRVVYRYDWNAATQLFESVTSDKDQLSIDTFGEVPVTIDSKGLRASLTGTATLISDLIQARLDRYKRGAPIVSLRTFLKHIAVEAGDIVSLTSSLLPNRYTKTRGLTNSLFEVIRKRPAFDQGYIDWDLLWTSFSLLSSDDFNRADVDIGNGNDALWTALTFDDNNIKILSNELYLGAGDNGGAFLAAGSAIKTALAEGADHISELEFRSTSGASRSGPSVRGNGLTLFTGYAAVYEPGSTQLNLRKYVSQNLTVGDTGTSLDTHSVTLVAGDRVRIRAVGTAITVYLNDTEVMSATDSAITTGYPGFVLNHSGAGATIKQIWDNWRGGDVGWA